MNNPRDIESLPRRAIRTVDALPLVASDDAVIQLIGAAFARTPLTAEDLRDVRLIAFLLDADSGGHTPTRIENIAQISPAAVGKERLTSMSGLSGVRVQRAIAYLMEAAVLERVPGDPTGWFRFSSAVFQPIGIDQYVDWTVVLGKLTGHAPAISVLRAALDLMTVPWEWSRLTYESLATRACYSIGMAQRGISQLLHFGVLEREAHTGRGHDYRLSTWALGRGPVPFTDELAAQPTTQTLTPQASTGDALTMRAALAAPGALTSMMAVEIGGLVVRVPVGTEIRMTIGLDGEPSYQVGPELKITRRV